jgi:hypothetical protein
MAMKHTRRRFLTTLSLAGAAAMLTARDGRAEPALETTTVRFGKSPVI